MNTSNIIRTPIANYYFMRHACINLEHDIKARGWALEMEAVLVHEHNECTIVVSARLQFQR